MMMMMTIIIIIVLMMRIKMIVDNDVFMLIIDNYDDSK